MAAPWYNNLMKTVDSIEKEMNPYSQAISNYLSNRVNLGILAGSTALASFLLLLSASPHDWRLVVGGLAFFVYMHFISTKMWWDEHLGELVGPKTNKYHPLGGLRKAVLQFTMLRLIVLLEDFVHEVENASILWVLVLTFAFLHFVFLLKFFYMFHDFGLGDGLFTIIIGALTHKFRGPWGKLCMVIVSSFLILVLYFRNTCCEECMAKKEEEKRVQDEAEQRAKAEEEKRARYEAEQRAKAEEEKRTRDEAEQRAKAEEEKRARDEAEQRAKAEEEKRARDEAEQRAKAEEEEERAREAEQKAKEEEKRARDDAGDKPKDGDGAKT